MSRAVCEIVALAGFILAGLIYTAVGLRDGDALEIDITDAQHQPIRVRIQPLNLKVQQEDCLMLILEDRQQAHRRRAMADGKRYEIGRASCRERV